MEFFLEFGIINPCSATYQLVVGAPVLLNLATKASFGDKKNCGNLNFKATFPKQKRSCATKKISSSDKFGMIMSD